MKNSFQTLQQLQIGNTTYQYHSLKAFEAHTGKTLSKLPFSLKILLENLLRHEDHESVQTQDILAISTWQPQATPQQEIQFRPARVLLQDFTGVPVIADLACMRDAVQALGKDPAWINPLEPADLVIDHSVQVDHFGHQKAFEQNVTLEFERNQERYEFLKWGQKAFQNFRVVPPDTGIVHQVNLEYLSQVAMVSKNWIYPDTLVGTDSHTTMINGLGVLGWGVGGIEAEAALLGQPCSMLLPQVVGFELKGILSPKVSATDLVLTVTQMLRKKGVVGKFVEFFGSGLRSLTLADRATVANMAPEYGATVGLFPVDRVTTDYLRLTGRSQIAERVKAYFQAQELWYDPEKIQPEYSDTLQLDLTQVEPSLAGPSRPQDRVPLSQVPASFIQLVPQATLQENLHHGSVVLAAITSCTNTSNPQVLITAGLLARHAVQRGLQVKPWVKTSLAPGSQVVMDYLKKSGLLKDLETLRFHIVGFGCTTCIGNSGPLIPEVSQAIEAQQLQVASVLSGNRNFEGRIHSQIKANYLASPALVIAYALAGSLLIDFQKEPLGYDTHRNPVFLKDLWPLPEEVFSLTKQWVTQDAFEKSYQNVFQGHQRWQELSTASGKQYPWNKKSTYIQKPPYFENFSLKPQPLEDIQNARVLAYLGDSVTTDHISPAGEIHPQSPAGQYLKSLGVRPEDFNSYGSRRGNHEIMMRGTFANSRLKNLLIPGIEGGMTQYFPENTRLTLYEAAMKYQAQKIPLIIIAGQEYGTGSSRDWAAKGPQLLGIRAVIAESFERIHRSNLIGMGILPLQFLPQQSAKTLGLTATECFDLLHLKEITVGKELEVQVKSDTKRFSFHVKVRLDTPNELAYFQHGGILPYVLRQRLQG